MHHAIYLGDPAMADKARSLIRQWRDESLSPEDRRRQELLQLWDLTAAARGFSRRARARVRAAAQEAFGDRAAELGLTYQLKDDDSGVRFGKPAGRP